MNNYYKSFCATNGYKMEHYAKQVIFKQLKNRCMISHDYNSRFDLILNYKDKSYNIEIKSCKKYLTYHRNGKEYVKKGQFKIGHKQITDIDIDIFIFIEYYRKYRKLVFVSGERFRKYFKKKNKVIHYSLSANQINKYMKPKLNILGVM